MRYFSKCLTAILLSFCIILAGCSVYDTAKKTNAVIGAVFALIQTDLPALVATGVIPLPVVPIIDAFVDLGVGLNGSLTVCLDKGHVAPDQKSAFLACYLAFSSGIRGSKEMAALKLLSPTVEAQVQIWLAALDTAVTSVIIALGGTAPSSLVRASVANSPAYKAFEKRVLAYAHAHPINS